MKPSKALEEFVEKHWQDDPARLLLKAKAPEGYTSKEAVQQLIGAKIAKQKLPSWWENKQILYPVKRSLEQCSSELTARYKTHLVRGQSLLDLSGGFGVDTSLFASSFKRVLYIEPDPQLAQLVQHNFKALGLEHVHTHVQTAEVFLAKFSGPVDVIYLDPSRRDDRQQRLVALEDCEPNIVTLLPQLKETSQTVLLKASPLLDIRKAIQALPGTSEVHVVSVKNECKEILFVIEQEHAGPVTFHAVDLLDKNQQLLFSFNQQEESDTPVTLSLPKSYLYEPNVAILKAGGFKSIARHFELDKLHPNSHLYTSDKYMEDFPGRVFNIVTSYALNKKEIKRHLPGKQANITVRNFPLSVEAIRKKTGITEGGDQYLFATTDMLGKKILLQCVKGKNSQ
ncbi:hypothetical protein AAG747_08260 [Rapidithrix thailandica]|uniref:THUMP-like domain-containing protein n=1 Tax=Rapidithrix thailandica TaxID=413964 RepID=A0AAW9S202_9BACT